MTAQASESKRESRPIRDKGMNPIVLESRKRADAKARQLLDRLMEMDSNAAPKAFAGLIGELRLITAKSDGLRMRLDTLKPKLDQAREHDAGVEKADEAFRECRKAVVRLAVPLAKRALHAMLRGHLETADSFRPLIESANRISEIKKSIEGVKDGDGFWGKSKAKAERLMHQGKLKVAQFKLHGGLKDAGKAILKAKDEERYRCEPTEEILGDVSKARSELDAARDNLKDAKESRSKFFNSSANELGVDTLEDTDDLERVRKEWTAEFDERERIRDSLTDSILERALDEGSSDPVLSEVGSYREARLDLNEKCRDAVRRMERVDWPALRTALGESATRCPAEMNYLRGVDAFDDLVSRDNRKLGVEVCEHGLALCLPAAGKQPFVGLPDDSIVSIELEDMKQIYEKRRGNVVADSLIGFVTGGVKGAFMRGAASGVKERKVAVEMPDLVTTIILRRADDTDRAIHLALSFDDKEEAAEFFKKQFGDRFRLVTNKRKKRA